jgi:hypothetical protein
MLDCALNVYDGYIAIVEGDGENLTQQQVFHLRSKALYLQSAYDVALKKMGKGTFDWTGVCCKEAEESFCDIGVKMT